jgi:hypothetical protein
MLFRSLPYPTSSGDQLSAAFVIAAAGPYYEWSHLKAGKLRHQTLSPEQAALMRLAIANQRKAKKLLRAWEVQTQRLIELNAP